MAIRLNSVEHQNTNIAIIN